MSDRPRPLGDDLAERLVEAVVGGDYPAGSTLPSEAELAEMAGVSRLTVREAIKSLQAKGVVRVERGRGTFVNAVKEWSPLDPRLLAARSGEDGVLLAKALLETRRLVEEGITSLAAQRRTSDDLQTMKTELERMKVAQQTSDIDEFIEGDIGFHQALFRAAANPVAAALYQPIQTLIHEARRETSSGSEARLHALEAHGRILTAVTAGDPEAARAAMARHLGQTEEDLEEIRRQRSHRLDKEAG